MQNLPSATERLQRPDIFGAGRPGDNAMRSAAPWAMGLAERGATPVGRSTRDPYRALEMLSRGTARPGQVQAALGLRQLQQQDQDPIDAIRGQQMAIGNNQNDGGGMPYQQGQGGMAPSMFGGTFSRNLFQGGNQPPSVSASRSAIGGSMSGRAFGGSGIPYRAF